MLDDSLRRALETRLRPDKDMNKKLFRVTGPLGNTGPKIDLGYQLGLFEKTVRNAMYGISEIRNLFAHDMEMSFASGPKAMSEAFNKMQLQANMHLTEHAEMSYLPHQGDSRNDDPTNGP